MALTYRPPKRRCLLLTQTAGPASGTHSGSEWLGIIFCITFQLRTFELEVPGIESGICGLSLVAVGYSLPSQKVMGWVTGPGRKSARHFTQNLTPARSSVYSTGTALMWDGGGEACLFLPLHDSPYDEWGNYIAVSFVRCSFGKTAQQLKHMGCLFSPLNPSRCASTPLSKIKPQGFCLLCLGGLNLTTSILTWTLWLDFLTEVPRAMSWFGFRSRVGGTS